MSGQSKPQFGEFCWNELMTADTKKAKDFYTALFGWTTQEHDMGGMIYTIFMSGDKSLGGMMQTPKEKIGKVPPHWMSYICVENVEMTLEKAKSLGASVMVPVTNVAEMGRFAIVTDPTGAAIAFWQSL
jgi:uncharacterized protein